MGQTKRWHLHLRGYAVYVRAKSGWTRHWFLSDLLAALGVTPQRLTEDMFRQAVNALDSRPYTVVVDEVEHALANHTVMEGIRDISDATGIPLVLVGMDQVKDRIRSRYPQISSRIAVIVYFQPVSKEDVAKAATTLLEEVKLADDLVEEVFRQCEGRMRLVMNALGNCERIARQRKAGTLSLKDVEGQELIHDWQSKRPRLVKLQRQV
ncbi:AAA family ATPase [Geothrix sp. PMB-07]|uniref:AAA family ATPase n=1 Tax=Geothrix sp. PMB-07 TaxID=3068640 RepID=UPI0027424A26|nr:AAA family ATPase [Geothrix sp. PMB-07]WLT32260.1 AAA family ATPase [Geothrix sp. PMB-07]